jgi:hypothetical protein
MRIAIEAVGYSRSILRQTRRALPSISSRTFRSCMDGLPAKLFAQYLTPCGPCRTILLQLRGP